MACAKEKICTSDFNRLIQILDRDISPPPRNDTELGEDFQNVVHVWASVKTVNGATIFDSVNTEQVITHIFTTRYLGLGITSENWIIYNNNRFKILAVENIDEQNMYTRMRCILRGSVSKEATKA